MVSRHGQRETRTRFATGEPARERQTSAPAGHRHSDLGFNSPAVPALWAIHPCTPLNSERLLCI
jgi:hypothetical protein